MFACDILGNFYSPEKPNARDFDKALERILCAVKI